MSLFTASTVTSVSVEGRVIRADGTVEELGTLAAWHSSPLRRLKWRISQLLRGRKPGRITREPRAGV